MDTGPYCPKGQAFSSVRGYYLATWPNAEPWATTSRPGIPIHSHAGTNGQAFSSLFLSTSQRRSVNLTLMNARHPFRAPGGSATPDSGLRIPNYTHINLATLDQAVDLVRVNKLADGSREAAFLRAYPALLAAIQTTDRVADAFLLAATFAHGSLPSSLRIEQRWLTAAVQAFGQSRSEQGVFSEQDVMAVATCLQSLVAASRVLHFANPTLYPTWDSHVEGFRLGLTPTPYHMAQTSNYAAYVKDIQGVKGEAGFLGFHFDYCVNYQERLRQLAIPPYPLTDMRVVESAVREIILAQGGQL